MISKRKYITLFLISISIFLLSGCNGYEKYYHYYSDEYLNIFYPKDLDSEYIDKLTGFINVEVASFYGYFLPDLDTSGIETVILIDKDQTRINDRLLESINTESNILNFDLLMAGGIDYTEEETDTLGYNFFGTNFIFLKKGQYDSPERLASTYIAELSHILLYKNLARNCISEDNKSEYIDEFFSNIDIHIVGETEYTFDRVRKNLDTWVMTFDEYPDKLKDPNEFNLKKLDNYLDDYLLLYHILIEDEVGYEKFKKTMVELFSKQYPIDNNTVDWPFINNYGKTLDELLAEWSPERM